jgi:hypothetical protein
MKPREVPEAQCRGHWNSIFSERFRVQRTIQRKAIKFRHDLLYIVVAKS